MPKCNWAEIPKIPFYTQGDSIQESFVEVKSNFETQEHSTLSKPVVITRKRHLTPGSVDIKLIRFASTETSNVESLSPFPTSVYSSQLERQQIFDAELEPCI